MIPQGDGMCAVIEAQQTPRNEDTPLPFDLPAVARKR